MKYLIFGIFLISIIALAGCSQTVVKYQCADGSFVDSANSCSSVSCKTDCPQLDCASCPVKTETKVETKTVTNTVYVCSDLSEVKNKDDCLKSDSEGWYEVKTISGASPKATESFTINSAQWRYTLTCTGITEYSMYNLEVKKLADGQPSQVDFRMMAKCESKGEPSYVYEGKGDYFFDINPVNMGSWTIKVEAKK